MVASMMMVMTPLPRNSYFASANPPMLLRVTTSTVWTDERKMELTSQCARAGWTALENCRESTDQDAATGSSVVARRSSGDLKAAQMSQRNGRIAIAARIRSRR